MVDIKLVEAFVLLMRSGSFARAERDSGVPKATLSRQISRLEETLGLQLLVRTTRRVAATEAGRAFFAHGERLLAEVSARLEAARTEVQDLADGSAGELALLTDTHFSTSFLCHIVRRYVEQHPNVRCTLDIADRPTSPAVDAVDCYVCSQPPQHPNLVAKLLGRLGYSLFASPRYLQRHPAPQHPKELGGHAAIVLHEAGRDGLLRLHGRDASHLWKPQPAMRTNDYWVMKTFCIDGFGLALLPDFFTRPEVEAGALVPVLPGWHPEPSRVYCAYQKQRYQGRKLRGFIDLMAACFNEIDSLSYYVGSAPASTGALRIDSPRGRAAGAPGPPGPDPGP
jgi:DNA-binding transcriptional LysR family regulator